MTNDKIVEILKKQNIYVSTQEKLNRYTTLNIGGPAKYFVYVENLTQLVNVLSIAKVYNEKILVIGAGSNMLISDKGFDGIVIKLKRDFNTISIEGEQVVAYSAAMLPMLIKTTVDYSLAGLEELFGIPGSVGGGIIMNAGTKTSTISDYLEYIEVIKINTPEEGIIKLAKEQINFKYRSSGLEDQNVVIKACFKLKKGDSELLKKRINECLLKRSETQPLGTFNAGCVFKNPYEGGKDITAAKLIESAGLKGFSIGGACVSEKHANFIINKNNATCEDFVNLIKYVIKVVKEKYSVELQPEITLVGVEL